MKLSPITPAEATRGIAHIDKLLSDLGLLDSVSPISKAAIDPLDHQGFDRVVIGLLRTLKQVAREPEQKAISEALKHLDQPWAHLAASERSRAVDAAAKRYTTLTRDVGPEVGRVLSSKAVPLAQSVMTATKSRYDMSITPSLDAVDRHAVEYLGSSQAHYVSDAYGQRSEKLSETARSIVAKGLEQGHDRNGIAEALAKALPDLGRSDSYLSMVASVFCARARSYSTLSSFSQAGIKSMRFTSVLDEVTSEVCRFLNGHVFSVGNALSRFHQVAASSDPESVKLLQPWPSVAKSSEGQTAFFIEDAGGDRRPLSTAQSFEAAGCSTPPIHGHCRSLLLPS